ncbi:MAG: GNAT family N-acetyltransferase [Actinobacteria bacterium]|nr:GNAT family N-acetyltransferase [Actinomycetota bacterium]
MEPVQINAGRLLLRPWQASDADPLQRVLDDPEIARWTPHPYPTPPGYAAARIAADADLWAEGVRAELAVLDATTGALLGSVGLYRFSPGRAEVGWLTAEQARRSGVAGEAVSALCRWAFQAGGMQRLDVQVLVGNWGSRRVAEKSGFTIEGVQRGAVPQTVRFLPVPDPYSVDDGLLYVSTVVPTGWAEGTAANVAVTDAATGELLGAVGLKLELRQHQVGEVGYWTAPWARGRGVAGRAAALHGQWGQAALGLNRIELLADVENLASQRAADKAGYVREGVLRRSRPDRTGEARDMVLFALT